MTPFYPSSEVNRKLMKSLAARDGAVYMERINRDGYEIIERSRAETLSERDTLSQCISVKPGPLLRPYMK